MKLIKIVIVHIAHNNDINKAQHIAHNNDINEAQYGQD